MLAPVIVVLAAASSQAGSGVPEPMRLLREHRGALRSGRVTWSYEDRRHRIGDDAPRTRTFVSRFAGNGDMIFEERGDQDGWVEFQPDGSPIQKFPLLWLVNDEGVLLHLETTISASMWLREAGKCPDNFSTRPICAGIRDIRVLGALPDVWESLGRGLPALDDLLLPGTESAARVRWEHHRQGTRHRVTRRSQGSDAASPGQRIEWELDEERGWNPVSIRQFDGDTLVAAVENDLAAFDGLWFPKRCRVSVRGDVVGEIVVREARFNRKGDPARFTPADLGLESGYNVYPQNFKLPASAGAVPIMRWSDEGLVDLQTFIDGVASGKYYYSDHFQEFMRGGYVSHYATPEQRKQRQLRRREMQLSSGVKALLSDWDVYLSDFCRVYDLSIEQREKALQIFEDCREQAARYLDQRQDKAKGFARQLTDARKAGGSTLQSAHAELQSFLQPVEDIFENRLKPRLMTIPTAKQVQEKEGRAASQPSAPARAP